MVIVFFLNFLPIFGSQFSVIFGSIFFCPQIFCHFWLSIFCHFLVLKFLSFFVLNYVIFLLNFLCFEMLCEDVNRRSTSKRNFGFGQLRKQNAVCVFSQLPERDMTRRNLRQRGFSVFKYFLIN